MTIDAVAFTPWSALAGGALIGLAAAILVLFAGRIAGVSGILGGLLPLDTREAPWRVAFVVGLCLAPAAYLLVAPVPGMIVEANTPMLVVAGLLVGLGTRYAAGCTSGHGVCGLSRLSPRSLVATLTFMAAGVVVVFVTRHVIGA